MQYEDGNMDTHTKKIFNPFDYKFVIHNENSQGIRKL